MATGNLKRGPIFVTGATGFIGRPTVAALSLGGLRDIRCLVRNPGSVAAAPGVVVVRGELEDPAPWASSLRGVDTVLHLAAKTGPGVESEFLRANVEGTRALLEASRAAGVRRFLFVSSIVTRYGERRAYHYAESKTRAERLVGDSGLSFRIVRPTMVLGQGAKVWRNLSALGGLPGPFIPVPGGGGIRVQPVWVDDVVSVLLDLVDEADGADRALDLGGPTVVSMADMLRRIHRAVRRRDASVIAVPIRPLIRLLAAFEAATGRVLPVSAGQFAAFVNDSIATPDPLVAARHASMLTLDAMIETLARHD